MFYLQVEKRKDNKKDWLLNWLFWGYIQNNFVKNIQGESKKVQK